MKLPGYTLKRKLGQGGMAAVYLAIQESFEREVALKIMMPQLAREPQFAERFMREARTVAQLSHPHIVTVYDVGFFQNVHYIAMEYHTGGDLTVRLQNGVTPTEGLRIISEMADALAFAHERGIIHRDIKPDNILFRAHNNAAILTDFGIAKRRSEVDLTQAGSTVGTPKYMSPEQARGQILDGRADLYSLGVILYEMLTGSPPFMANDPVAMAIKHCQEPPPPLREPLARYQPLLDKLLAKAADDRFDSGTELMEAIEALQRPAPLVARPAAPPPPPPLSLSGGPVPAPAATPAPPPAPGKPADKPKLRRYQAFYTTEETTTGGLLSRRHALTASFSADDFNEFKQQFQKLQDELGQWIAKRGKKASGLKLRIQAHPWIHGQVRDVLGRSRMQNTAFGQLLQHGEVKVHLHDEDDLKGVELVLSENGDKSAKAPDAAT
jgi:serine/threonine protein kinase